MATNETATFAVQLKDGTSGPANEAADAIAQLRERLMSSTKQLDRMREAQARLKAGGIVSKGALASLTEEMGRHKVAVGIQQAALIQLGGAWGDLAKKVEPVKKPMEDAAKAAKPAATAFESLVGTLKGLGGPIGESTGHFEQLKKVMAGGGGLVVGGVLLAASLVVVVGVLIEVGRAALDAAVQLARYALSSANAARSERLRIEGIASLDRHQRNISGSAASMGAAISRVAGSVALSGDQVTGYAAQLTRAGVRGAAFEDALRGIAITSAVQGEESAQAFARTAIGASRAGRSVRDLADQVQGRLGGIARRQLLDFDVQMERLQLNIGRLFSGVDLESFLEGLHTVTELFSQQTASGRALRTIMSTIFSPLFEGASRVFPIIRAGFEGFVIGSLVVVLAVLRIRNTFNRALGVEVKSNLDGLTVALYAGAAAAGVFALALLPFVAVLAGVVAIGAAPFVAIAGLAVLAEQVWNRARAAFAIDKWIGFGTNIVDGLIGGISTRFAALRTAVAGLASTAANSLSSALEIRSPSRVFARLGVQIPAGLAAGIEEGSGQANQAASDVVRGSSETAARPSARRGAGLSLTIENITINTSGGDARSIAADIREQVAQAFETLALEMGAPA